MAKTNSEEARGKVMAPRMKVERQGLHHTPLYFECGGHVNYKLMGPATKR